METDFVKRSYKISVKENLSLNVYNTGYQRCEAGYPWGPGTRDHYLFHYVTQGKGTLSTPEGEVRVESGGLFLIRPGELTAYTADPEDPWVYYWVGFNGTEAHRLVNLTGFAHGERLLYPENGDAIREQLTRITNARGSTPAHEARMLGYLYLFLGGLMSLSGGEKPTTSKQYVDKAVRFIGRNYSRDITICDVADFVGISESHLYRVFSREFSMAPAQFLMRYRIGEAAAMLRNTGLAIGEIAASVGFRDPLYFSRVFKRIKGVSPREYGREKEEEKS